MECPRNCGILNFGFQSTFNSAKEGNGLSRHLLDLSRSWTSAREILKWLELEWLWSAADRNSLNWPDLCCILEESMHKST